MSFPFSIPNKIGVSFILGILVYAMFNYCFLPNINLSIKMKFYGVKSDYVFLLIYALSLVLVIPSTNTSYSSFYLPWTSLNPLNVANLIASILLTSFLPGYALLKIIMYKSREPIFSNIGTGVLSLLLSFIVTSLTTYFYWVVEGEFRGVAYALYFSYSLFFATSIILLFLRRGNLNENKEPRTCVVSLRTFCAISVLLSVIAYLIWSFYSTHFVPQTMHIFGDELDHAGLTQQFLRGWQSWQQAETKLFYPYFFHLYLAAAASLSNVPFINLYLSFFFLLILPALAFYFMVQMIFENEKTVPLFATVIFSLFSGFGWIYYSSLPNASSMAATLEASTIVQASQRTCDIIYSTWLPLYIAPYVVDSSIFFVLIGLMGYKKVSTYTLCILTVLLTTIGILVHVEMMLVLSFLLLILSVLYAFNIAKFINHPKTILCSYIVGLLISCALNFIAQYQIGLQLPIIIDGLLIGVIGLTLVVASERFRKKMPFLSLKTNMLSHLKYALPYLMLSLYLILFVAFFYSFSSYSFNGESVPLWFLPLKFGVAGLLSLLGLFYSVRKRDSVNFFIILFAGTILMQLLLYHLPFSLVSVIPPEFRFIRDILWPFLSIIAAYGMKNLINIFKANLFIDKLPLKFLVACLLIFVIFASGIPSNLLKVTYFASDQQPISEGEIAALQYLGALKIPAGSFLLTGLSKETAYAVTGAQAYGIDDPIYGPLILNSKSSGTALYTLNYLNISYICLSSQDLQFLENKYGDSYFNWLLPKLPIVFSNNTTTIYAVPPFSPPCDNSRTAVVTGDLLNYGTDLTKNAIWMDENFTQGWKNVNAQFLEYFNFVSDGAIATMAAKTAPGQQAAVFYLKNFVEQIPTDNNTVAVIKFKSNTINSYAILDIIYSDGSVQRLSFENKGYMKSSDWAIVTNSLQPNKSVAALRIGLTDNKEGNGEVISVSFDYVFIAKTGEPADYYTPPLFAALMQINYTTTSEFDSSQFGYDTIIMPDIELPQTRTTQYIDWVKNGGNLVVINSNEQGTFGNFLGINATGRYLPVNSLVNYYSSYTRIPEIVVPELQLNASSTKIIANYASENSSASPLALLQNLGAGKILYIEATPILEKLAGNQYFVKTLTWLIDTMQKDINLPFFDSTAYTRTFYVKNIGKIFSQGETLIDTPSIVFSPEELDGVRLDFTGHSDVEKIESSLENITVSDINFNGAIPAEIRLDGNTTVFPLDSDNYAQLKLDGDTLLRFDLNNGNEVKITVKNSTYTNLLFNDGVLLLHISNAQNVRFVTRKPTLTTNGTTTFDSFFASYPYAFQSVGTRGTFSGNIEFKVKLSETSVLVLDEAQFDGNLRLDVTTNSVLTDDLHFFVNLSNESLLFILVIILLTIFVYIKTRKVKTMQEDS